MSTSTSSHGLNATAHTMHDDCSVPHPCGPSSSNNTQSAVTPLALCLLFGTLPSWFSGHQVRLVSLSQALSGCCQGASVGALGCLVSSSLGIVPGQARRMQQQGHISTQQGTSRSGVGRGRGSTRGSLRRVMQVLHKPGPRGPQTDANCSKVATS